MEEIFITKIDIEKSSNIENVVIPLSDSKRKHLILTGRNGSGKSSLLENLDYPLRHNRKENYKDKLNEKILYSTYRGFRREFPKVKLEFSVSLNTLFEVLDNNFIPVFFNATRNIRIDKTDKIEKINVKSYLSDYGRTQQKYNREFLQFLVNLKVDRSFAKDDEEMTTVHKIDTWFEKFENQLKKIFETNELQLKFKRENYSFDIIVPNREPFGFETLSDGYSSIISIIAELIIRISNRRKYTNIYDLQGVVLIDEIESHLHVSLQKVILPFLTNLFPKIQFIVSTHSPFVLSSISNAVIFDLEHKTVIEDLSQYSYDAIIESYFDSDKYSEEIKGKIEEYDQLSLIENKTPEQIHQFRQLKDYFDNVPTYKAPELKAKLLEIDLRSIKSKTAVD